MSEEQDKLIEMYEDEIKANPTDAIVDDILWKIKKTTVELCELRKRRDDARDFYEKKEWKIKERLEKLSQIVENYIRNTDRKTVDTPNGIARLRSVKKIRWDNVMDDELIRFSLANDIEMLKRPKKSAILTYIKQTGDAPEWFEEYTDTSFSYQIKENEDE
mgnify:CR=1 FL=1